MHSDDPGFQVIPAALRESDFEPIVETFENADRTRAGMRHLLQSAAVRRLAEDPRLVRLAAQFIGGSPVPFKATLFDKSPTSNWLVAWHQDVSLPIRARVDADGWGPWSIKAGQLYANAPADALAHVVALRVHLDDSTPDNAPLRVLPATHCLGRLSGERIRQLAQEIKPVECVVSLGGVVAIRPLAVHASSKSRSPRPRRVLHIEYARQLVVGSGIELAMA